MVFPLSSPSNVRCWIFGADFETIKEGSLAQGNSGFSSCGSKTTVTSSVVHSGMKAARFEWIYPEWSHISNTIGFDDEQCLIYDTSGGLSSAGAWRLFKVSGSAANDGHFCGYSTPGEFQIALHPGFGRPKTELAGKRITLSHGSPGFKTCRGEVGYRVLDASETISEGSQLWARAYYYFQSPWNWSCAPGIKILRSAHLIHTDESAAGMISVYADNAGRITLSNEPAGLQYHRDHSFDLDRWQCIEIYVKLSAELGIIRIWKDGILIIEDATAPTMMDSSDYAVNAWFMGWWNGGVTQFQINYIDDILITTELPDSSDMHGNPFIGPKVKVLPPTNLNVIIPSDE